MALGIAVAVYFLYSDGRQPQSKAGWSAISLLWPHPLYILNTEWLIYDMPPLAYFYYTQLHTDLEESEAPHYVQRQRLDGRSYRYTNSVAS